MARSVTDEVRRLRFYNWYCEHLAREREREYTIRKDRYDALMLTDAQFVTSDAQHGVLQRLAIADAREGAKADLEKAQKAHDKMQRRVRRNVTALSNARDELQQLALELSAATNALAQRAFARYQPRIAAFCAGNAYAHNVMGHGLHICVCGNFIGDSVDINVIERRFLVHHKPKLDPDAGHPPRDYMVEDVDGALRRRVPR